MRRNLLGDLRIQRRLLYNLPVFLPDYPFLYFIVSFWRLSAIHSVRFFPSTDPSFGRK
ncbi:hypothetical protein BT96DRAFT_1062076 [Gymnopus androsaceus JB14]|uniref:Uncharacterized protein n=1 Tax=Gymnopus androsaceus JB14 TaxID=1447944 RepID=A0A6A4H180_9AGAR|nr:hypothetical protein BT96DRAFT_1062076 [Gymnopus androsaceus JB14]